MAKMSKKVLKSSVLKVNQFYGKSNVMITMTETRERQLTRN